MSAVDPKIAALGQPMEGDGQSAITLEKWHKLIEVFRAQGPNVNYREAGRIAETKPQTAKKAFEEGTPKLRRPAIRDLLLREQVSARAQAQAETTKLDERVKDLGGEPSERVAAGKQATATKAQESRLLAGARVTAEVCLAVAGKLLKAAGPLTERMAQEILRELNPGPGADGKPRAPADLRQANAMMRMLFDYSREATGLARSVVDLERILVGSPQVAGNLTAEVSTAEATQELVAAARMIKRFADEAMDPALHDELVRCGVDLREASPLRVIQGGKT